MVTSKEQLEKRIEYWIAESMLAKDEARELTCKSTLYLLSKEYKELTGEYYGHK